MRRGLIARSLVELPDAVFDARLDRLRAVMQAAELDALVIYTNNTRPAGVSWLAGFVPYWSEAVLVVPRQGGPYLVAALTRNITLQPGDVILTGADEPTPDMVAGDVAEIEISGIGILRNPVVGEG